MKFRYVIAFLLVAATAQAQTEPSPAQQQVMQKFQSMTPQERQQYMQSMQQVQTCFNAAGGPQKMQEVGARGKAMWTEIKRLCAAGQRSEAQAYAMREGEAMSKDPAVQKLKQCSKDMQTQMKDMIPQNAPGEKPRNVCDSVDGK